MWVAEFVGRGAERSARCPNERWSVARSSSTQALASRTRGVPPSACISITGVEPFEPCITDIQRALCDDIVPRDILEALPALGHFDLAILGDVIEHLGKADAYDLLGRLFEHTENIIVSTPLGFMPQGAWAGNERETHQCGWEARDFEAFQVIEQQVVRDELVPDLLRTIPGVPEEMKDGIRILVV